MALLAALLFLQSGDIDRLILELGDENIEVRERAHARLLASGTPAIPALRKAACSTDAELRVRAGSLLDVVERAEREKSHDADQLAALLLLNRDVRAENRPGSAATQGARFDLSSEPFEDGWVITTRVTNYLARSSSTGPGRGLLDFDLVIVDSEGRELPIERCGMCSPKKILVRSAGGPWKARLKGGQTWFSPYVLEFKNPSVGQSKRVGDYSIEVTGLELKVSSSSSFSWDWVRSMNTTCEFELKPEITTYRPRVSRCGFGGRGGFRAGQVQKANWCDCPNGPQPVKPKAPTVFVSEFQAGKAIDLREYNEPATVDEPRPLTLEDYARITYTFWKPIEIPIDLTVELNPDKRD